MLEVDATGRRVRQMQQQGWALQAIRHRLREHPDDQIIIEQAIASYAQDDEAVLQRLMEASDWP